MKPRSAAEQTYRGKPASPGLAMGALVRLAAQAQTVAETVESASAEKVRLEGAIGQAKGELSALIAANDAMGADILEFQRELLDDSALAEAAFAAIAGGSGAATAWRRALGEQIAAYESADDDYFRARAGDLADLRDRVIAALTGASGATSEEFPEGTILLADDLTPSRFLAMDWQRLGGAALTAGSRASHVAMLARARGVPLLTGLQGEPVGLAEEAVLDAQDGVLVVSPNAGTRALYAKRIAAAQEQHRRAQAALEQPAVTPAGQRIEVMVNVDDPGAVADEILAASDGVGLMRTEFLFIGRPRLPTEDEQHAAYVRILDRLGGKPVVIRTLDVGGDKPLPGVNLAAETNPFLGLRGIRLCLEKPELFRPQVRALLRAGVNRALRVMLPMIATADELTETRQVFAACLAELRAQGMPAELPPLGIMVETPAAAIAIDLLDAAFYSIGSNDLTQYVMAAARDSGGRVAALNDPGHPAVMRLIKHVVAHGQANARPVSLCGDMASDPALLKRLLATGLKRLSVAPAALGRIKLAIAEADPDHG
ncbi:MAG TPA: phosphoenolpyruvate--protein phosphotransferase [Candidatus Angelobacter sp.]|nr:phosphoenolpyruvate--protein phosphotransferase [Candidatus Angelobacter sp.]